MSQDDLSKKTKKLKNNMPGRSYEVGYGKPPEATRFVKGKSGNPKGRPKGSKNQLPAMNEERLGDIIMQEAYRTIKLKDGAKQVRIPMAQAIVRSIAVNAARGDLRAQKTFMDLVSKKEAKDKKAHDELLQTMIDYKISWQEEIKRCELMGITPPDPVPHPDQIKIDFSTGQVLITGPITREEKAKWDKMKKRKIAAREAIESYEQEIRSSKDEGYIKFLENEITFEKRIIEIISKAVPD